MDTEVLVVGAGPVGLSTALFLSACGVRCTVVEKREATFPHHRAGASARTLELFRSVGLGERLDEIGWATWGPLRAVVKDNAFGSELARIDLPARYSRRLAEGSPIPAKLVAQDELESLVLGELADRGVPVRFETRLIDLEDGEDAVTATVTGSPSRITARYAVACDGARSGIRDRIGATMPDREVVGYPTTVFYRADLGDVVRRWRTHFCFVRNPSVFATVASFNGRDLWSSHIMDFPGKPAGPADLSDGEALRLLRAALGDENVAIDLLAVNSWEAALGISSVFRAGRVFLAGDAAHVQTSAGGLGMNTGIQDGHNLAWKLAAVLRGEAGEKLLDTYEPERRAAAVASLTVSRELSRGFTGGGDAEDWYAEVADHYLRAMTWYRYRSPAILSAGESGHDVLDDVVRPGYRVPHRWLGDRLSTVDIPGPGWLALTGTGSAVDDRVATAMPVHPLPDDLGHGEAALVRPDGFVAWRGGSGGLHDAVHAILRPA